MQRKTSKNHVISKRKNPEIDTKIPFVCNLNSIFKGSFSTDLQQKYFPKKGNKKKKTRPKTLKSTETSSRQLRCCVFVLRCGYETLEHFPI